ncbi:FecR family protein [Porticoccus sp. GXU_MW_L64]
MENNLLPEELERIEGEAADWLLTMNDGSLSDETLAQWRSWIDASPHHRDCYEKMLKLWSLADQLPEGAGVQEETNVIALPARKPRWLWQSMAAAAALVMAVVLLFPKTESVPITALGSITGLKTATAEHASHKMPDGTVIELGADSRIQLAYSDTERKVFLVKGEASFDVAKDPDKPFIVSAGAGQYMALGTVFNVELTSNHSTLTVVEGVVQARLRDTNDAAYDGTNFPRLVANESVTVTADGTVGDVHKVDASSMIAWQKGQLVFVDQPFQEVFERLNRYRETPVVIADELKQLRYTGSVHKDNMDSMISLLPEVFPVRVVNNPDGVYLTSRQ